MKNQLSAGARIVSLVCAVALAIVIFVPMWRIDLTAPQYPEGLVLKIHANKLGGNVDIINGLNHYIGMRTLHTEDFVEFIILPYLIATFALFGVLTAIINRRWFFYTWTGFYILFGIVAMFDFYRWEYNYGHNLDPTAAIIVPGMSYQPPLIGYKKLLNFGAYSFPDIGGYIFIAVGLILVVVGFLEWKKARKISQSITAALGLSMIVMLQSCSAGPQPIAYGKDACHFCKMMISDQRFGAELISNKNKVYKFDDISCITSFIKSAVLKKEQIASVYLIDFSQNGVLVKAEESYLFQSEELRSPMSGNIAAFAKEESRNKFKQELSGTTVQWGELIK